jgi:hypothetical protein
MRTSRHISSFFLCVIVLLLGSAATFAADPGLPFSLDGAVNDQKAGSILFYNVYTSSAATPTTEDTLINITNTSSTSPVTVHLYFIDGATCTPADFSICMSPNQTFGFRASEYDPGTTGYIMAVAIDNDGCPIIHNALIGDEYVRFASGHSASLGAEAVAARSVPACDENSMAVDLNFNGVEYDRLPSTLAIDNIPSMGGGNETMIILNRPTGDFALGADRIGFVSGLLYDDQERAFSFSFSAPQCQFRFIFSNTIPRTVPRFTTVVPSGRSGWVKLFTYNEIPLLGVVINHNASATSPDSFRGGHNMHKLRLTTSRINIPIFPTHCR